MKKFTALALAAFLCVSLTNAQLRFGVKAGANISDLYSTSNLINDVKAASYYQAGVLMQWKLGNFAIQPELLYSVKGAELRNAIGTSSYSGPLAALTDESTKLNYKTQNIEVPLNLQYGMGFGPAHVYAEAGPYISFQVATALEDAESGKDFYSEVNKNLTFNKIDYGIGLGVGAEFMKFQLSLKYDFGLKTVGKEYTNSWGTNLNPFYDMKNRNLNISLAYLF